MVRDWQYYFPRGLGALFIIFISLFSLDVFGAYEGWELLLALGMHLLPALVLLGVLVWAWKRPTWGGGAFLLLGVVFTFWFDTYREIISFLIVSLPVLVIGGLFLWEGLRKRR